MQLPTMSTPIWKCLELAEHTGYMLGKFPDSARLVELATRMLDGGATLDAAERAFVDVLQEVLRARIDLKYEDYVSDGFIRRLRKQAEIADGRRGGRIVSQVFPDGVDVVARLQGMSQIDAMRKLEARLAAAQDIWPEAAAAHAALVEHRQRYEGAAVAREELQQRIVEMRALRDAAKERFLHLYAEIANLVKAEFPRDRVSQDLFFGEVRKRSASGRDGDSVDAPGDEPAESPADTPDEGASAEVERAPAA